MILSARGLAFGYSGKPVGRDVDLDIRPGEDFSQRKLDAGAFNLRSTQLYPEWPLAVLPHVDAVTATAVADALQRMTPDMPAAQAANA